MHWDTLTDERRAYLHAEQEEIELNALDKGIDRFRQQCQGQALSQWPAVKRLMAGAVETMVEAIEAETIALEQGKARSGALGWFVPFMVMDPGVLALCGLSAAFACFGNVNESGRVMMARAIADIGSAVQHEWHYLMLKQEFPRLKAVMERRIKKWNPRTMRRARKQMGELGENWDSLTRRRVGAKLLELVVMHTSLFEKKVLKMRRGKKSSAIIRLTDESVKAIAMLNDELEISRPVLPPMVIPPKRWDADNRGGYIILKLYTPFAIRGPGSPPSVKDHSDDVYDAVNIVQSTPWCINRVVLDTMTQVWGVGGKIGKMPPMDMLPLLQESEPFPDKGSDDVKMQWKMRAAQIHGMNARLVGKRLAFLHMKALADRYKSKVFYFPHHCDFRGRIYPTVTYLQPQGDDMSRGLLRFADGKKLGSKGLFWLMIHFANCWGVDKVSFGDREEWAYDTLLPMLGVDDPQPLEWKQMWAEAEKPWQALAVAWEIHDVMYNGHNSTQYVSHLPVSVDGSNSGLQHFSAMLRDEEGAKLVNLSPSDKPSDIYTDVADTVKGFVRVDRESGELPDSTSDPDLPAMWLKQDIDRKLVKRGTMTFCYGVTQQGLKDALITDGFVDWADNQFSAVQYIGKVIWKAIEKNITAATDVMSWLRRTASVGNKAGVLLEWRTPVGFHVQHPYSEPNLERIVCMATEVSFRSYNPDRPVSKHKQRNSLPPNFVHSLDACHLMMTVLHGHAVGITHWMMIHDSFGTHAADIDTLNIALRDEFVNLYTVDILEDFRQQIAKQCGMEVEPPPERGNFNLEDVYESEYIFS